MSHVNDNVYHNLKGMSVIHYDMNNKVHKHELSREKKETIANQIVHTYAEVEDQNRLFNKALERILIVHRNTRLFLIMMSGPFLVLITLIRYTIKFSIIYYLYKRSQAGKNKPLMIEDAMIGQAG